MEDWATELAKDDIKNTNPSRIGNIVGSVININPLKISILDGNIILQKEHLYICNSLRNDYIRQFTLQNFTGTTNSVNDGGDNASSHSHNINSLEGEIKFTDTLKIDDKVLLVSTVNEQTWFIIDKITKL